VNSTVFFPKAR